MVTQIFVNLPVKDLNASMEFFKKLGFTFNPQFTDETAGALVLGENIFAMLLTHEKFKSFVKKEIADSTKTIESITAIQVESKELVDKMVEDALAAGGTEPRETYDYGFMYGRAFEDLDGHMWETFWMDPTQMPKE